MPVLPRLRSSWRLLAKEVGAFGVVGVVCFFVDVGTFQLLYAHLGIGAVTAKVVATVVGMTLAYFGHRHWSFSHRARTGVRREYLLFAVINGSTLLLGAAIIALVRYPLGQDDAAVLQVANVGSIVLSTLVRYLAYRRWVFPAHEAGAGDDTDADARIVA
ncbi:GtrA family protein [Geodermatophilus sp. SYSU D00703]